jgi:hypothetical protein
VIYDQHWDSLSPVKGQAVFLIINITDGK